MWRQDELFILITQNLHIFSLKKSIVRIEIATTAIELLLKFSFWLWSLVIIKELMRIIAINAGILTKLKNVTE